MLNRSKFTKLGFNAPSPSEFRRHYSMLQFEWRYRLYVYILEESKEVQMYLQKGRETIQTSIKKFYKELREDKVLEAVNNFISEVNTKHFTLFKYLNYGKDNDRIIHHCPASCLED